MSDRPGLNYLTPLERPRLVSHENRPRPSAVPTAIFRAILFSMLIGLGTGLSGLVPCYAAVSSPEASRAALDHARSLLMTRQYEAAATALRNFLAAAPKAEDRDDAYFLLATSLLNTKEYPEAIGYLNQLLTEFPSSELAIRARLLLGGAYREVGNFDAAVPVLLQARSDAMDPEQKRQALRAIADVYMRKDDYPRAIHAWIEEMVLTPEDQRADIRQRVRDLVIEKLDKKALLQLRDEYPAEFPGDLALIRLMEMQSARGEEHLAERNARLFLHRFPSHEYSGAAADILRSYQAKLKSSQYVIGALLPLSGRLRGLALESVNGIQLALDKGRETLGVSGVGLKIVDSETDKTVLRSELTDTIAEYRPLAIIGPMLTRNLPLVAGVADQTETPFITPTATLSDVRHLSPYLFSTALTYAWQAQRIAEHAMAQLGHKRFAVLHPDTVYGREMARLFIAEVAKRGGEIVATETYKDSDTDFGGPIRRLKDADLKKHGTATTTKTAKGVVRVVYTPGFDAVFVPSDGMQAALMAPQLVFYDVKVPLLGTNTWNTPDLSRLADRTLDGSVFVDGFFLDSPDPAIREFVDRYRKRYQSDPTPFAAQAYDATRVVIEAIRRGATSGHGVREQLAKVPDLPALTGPAAFGSGGTLQRRLFMVYIKNGKLVQLN